MSAKPLQILRVVQSTYPEVVGGVGIHVHDMSKHQAEMGHDVTVLTSDNGNRSLPRKEKRDGYTVLRHREVTRPVDNSITPGIAKTLLDRASECDIIHAHSHLYFSTNISAAISKLSGTPFVLTNHGLFSQTAPMSLQKLYLHTLGRATMNSAERIFCYTERAKALLDDHGITAPVTIAHNGINCEVFTPTDSDESNKQLLFVGRLKPGKNPDIVIEAFDQLLDEFSDYTLKIAGDGPMRAELERYCEAAEIEENVVFAGEVAYDEMSDIYNQSDLIILPTKTEAAIPRVVMEAWACEIPAVMTNIQEVDEGRVKQAGLTCDEHPQDVADSVRRLIVDEDLRTSLGRTGREIVREHYSWNETVEQTTNEYYEVLNE